MVSELCPLKCGTCSNDVPQVTPTTDVTTTSDVTATADVTATVDVTLTSGLTATKIISKKENEPNVFFNQPKQLLRNGTTFTIFEPEVVTSAIPEVGIIPETLLEGNFEPDYDYEDEPEELERFIEETNEPFSSWYEVETGGMEEPEEVEILEEFAEEGSGDFDLLTPCERRKAEVESRMMMGAWLPSCTSEGDFEALQCNFSARTCWCVDLQGDTITGTEEFFSDPSRMSRKTCSDEDLIIEESSGDLQAGEDLSILDPLKQNFEGSGLFG